MDHRFVASCNFHSFKSSRRILISDQLYYCAMVIEIVYRELLIIESTVGVNARTECTSTEYLRAALRNIRHLLQDMVLESFRYRPPLEESNAVGRPLA